MEIVRAVEFLRANIVSLSVSEASSQLDGILKLLKDQFQLQQDSNDNKIQVAFHPKGHAEPLVEVDVLITHTSTGESVAKTLSKELKAAHRDITVAEFPVTTLNENEATRIEGQVTKSRFLVCILSNFCLQEPSFVFALECAACYNIPVLLVHAAENCPFPVCNNPIIGTFFATKAITFLSDYSYAATDQVADAVLENKYPAETTHQAAEDIHTRVFLSHKRTTAQAIAGRLYEGLKHHYRVFLDSEAQFKIHDLEKIVQQTDVFVFILSKGIFDSVFWCLKELRQAIAANKKIVIIRDFSYHLPETWSPELEDVIAVIKASPSLVWMAEYNSHCIKKLSDEFVGAPDRVLSKLDEWITENKTSKDQMKREVENDFVLKLNSWPENQLISIPVAFQINLGWTIKNITKVNFFECMQMVDEDTYLFKALPNVIDLNLEGCFRLSDTAMQILSTWLPQLEVLNISVCGVTDKGIEVLMKNLPKLTNIDVGQCRKITDLSAGFLSQHPVLHSIRMNHLSTVSTDGFAKLAKLSPRLQELTIEGTKTIETQSLTAVLQNASSLKKLNLDALHKIPNIIGLISQFECHKSLEDLHVEWMPDRETAWYQLGFFPKLKKVTAFRLVDESATHILKNCPSLEEIAFLESKLSDEMKTELRAKFRSVTFDVHLPHPNILNSPGTLHANEFIQSANGFYKLKMMPDGVLTLLDRTNEIIWKAGVPFKGKGPWRAVMQSDGNLVIYASDDFACYSSNSARGDARHELVMQDDRNLVIYRDGSPIWATCTPP